MARKAQRISVEEAAAMVRPGMWLDYGASIGQPDAFDQALAKRLGPLTDVRIRSVLTTRPRAVLEADPDVRHVHWFSTHFSGYDRRKHDAGLAHYLPVNLGEVPDYYRRFGLASDNRRRIEGVPQDYVLSLPFTTDPEGAVDFHPAFGLG